MRFARGDMRDHIVLHKNDHGASYGRYAVLQWWSRLKISFCEVFGVVQFSTFATLSAPSGHAARPARYLLSAVDRTCHSSRPTSAFDPTLTFADSHRTLRHKKPHPKLVLAALR
jgi:hypothetical protein